MVGDCYSYVKRAITICPEGNFGFFVTMNRRQLMQKVLELAQRGRGLTSPNPMVGALLVKNRRIVGQGYHRRAGEPHAEIEAIRKAGQEAGGSTLYVNLEPCCHFGKTPPCTDTIIKARIRKVVFSVRDPNAAVNGKGAKVLREAGTEVSSGLLKEPATKLNEAYFKFTRLGLPFVSLLIHQTLDGKNIDGPSPRKTWLYSRDERAILGPLLKSDLKMPGSEAAVSKFEVVSRKQALSFLKQQAQRGVLSVLVEGSGNTGAQFLKYRLVDKVYTLVSFEIGGHGSALNVNLGIKTLLDAIKLRDIEYHKLARGLLVSGYLN